MRLNFTIEIDDSMALQLIKAKGLQIIKHNFIDVRKEHHNRIVCIENIQPAVMIDQKIFSIKDAIEHLYNFDLKRGFFNAINRTQ